MRIAKLKKSDEKKIVRAAAKGMHFDWYFPSRPLCALYTRCFWYAELNRATQIIAAYEGEEFLGVLLFAEKGAKPCCYSRHRALLVTIFDKVSSALSPRGDAFYERANRILLSRYKTSYSPDGEIAFLVADPNTKKKGVGTFLLEELRRRMPGKEIFLYTDSGCTWEFYESRGFERAVEKRIILTFGKRKVPLDCMLYRIRF